jgi:hypothetical protein
MIFVYTDWHNLGERTVTEKKLLGLLYKGERNGSKWGIFIIE